MFKNSKKIILSLLMCSSLVYGAFDSIGTDYDKAPVSDFTEEAALDALETVNMILGFIKDSKADQFINKGPYKALLKNNENKGGGNTGTGIDSTVEKLSPMILDVTRNTDTSTNTNPPMIVKMWLDETDDFGPEMGTMTIRIIGYITASQGVSKEYPIGKLRFDFKGYLVNSSGGIDANAPMMRGAMLLDKSTGSDALTGRADVKFIEQERMGSEWTNPTILNMTYDVSVDTNSDGVVDSGDLQGSGVAYTRAMDWANATSSMDMSAGGEGGDFSIPMASYELAFSNEHYKIQEVYTASEVTRAGVNSYELTGTETCKSKTSFNKKVFRYGLFSSTDGRKVSLNSGFPIKTADGKNGYVGYWGIWSENDSISNGDTVTRVDGNGGTYTVFETLGKLIKHTKTSVTMEKLAGTEMYVDTYIGNDYSTKGQYVVSWDSTIPAFVLKGKQDCSNTGCELNTTLGNAQFSDLNLSNWSGAWSQSLQAQIPLVAPNGGTYTNSSEISFHKQETVSPNENLTLVNYGWQILNPDMNLSSDANFVTPVIEVNATNNVIGNTYTYDATNGVLLDVNRSNKAVVIPSDANWSINGLAQYNYLQWGARVGPLLESSSSAVTNATYDETNFWNLERNEDTYYTWEVGPNQWNKVSGVILGGSKVVFDKPLDIAYTHSTANDLNGDTSNDGKYFMLNYSGHDLGLPWKYDATNGWVPIINLKSGTKLGDNSEYVVKALDIGSQPALIAAGCDGALNPTKDVDDSFVPVADANGTSLLEFNDTIFTDGSISLTPPDANVSVIEGNIVQ